MSENGTMMFSTSDSTAKLDAALAKAQGAIDVALKTQNNDAFKRDGKPSKYADLTAFWDACRQALSDNQITFTQWPLHSTDNRVHLMTRVAHAGEWMQGEFSIPVNKNDAHGYGGGVTYNRRFCMGAVLGIVTEEDDDGNAAVGNNHERPTLPKARARAPYNNLEIKLATFSNLTDLADWWEKDEEIDKQPSDWRWLLFAKMIKHGFAIAESSGARSKFFADYEKAIGAIPDDEPQTRLDVIKTYHKWQENNAAAPLETNSRLKEQLEGSLNQGNGGRFK